MRITDKSFVALGASPALASVQELEPFSLFEYKTI